MSLVGINSPPSREDGNRVNVLFLFLAPPFLIFFGGCPSPASSTFFGVAALYPGRAACFGGGLDSKSLAVRLTLGILEVICFWGQMLRC